MALAPDPVGLDQRIEKMQLTLDLPEEIVRDLIQLAGTDIVVIADDSGSMNARAGKMTRWSELENTLSLLVQLLLTIDHPDGFTLKFLNVDTWFQVTSEEALTTVFAGLGQPHFRTPLCANLREVADGASWKRHSPTSNCEGDTICLVLTDGEPSDGPFSEVTNILKAKAANVFVTFLMCTDEDDVVTKYNRVVDPIPGCDISDDYASEKKEVERAGNKLNRNKWLAKCVLGGKLPKYDKMDSPKSSACCVVS